jgi:biopolymer transport protein ExbB/TolQ
MVDGPPVIMFVLMPLFLLWPFIALSIINAIVSYRRTRKWDKARKQTDTELEAVNTLLSPDEETDFLDTDDENEYNERKAEEENDRYLNFRQKWWKEFKSGISSKKAKREAEKKEREERRKLAKAVARELERERRGTTNSEGVGQDEEALPPPYRKD